MEKIKLSDIDFSKLHKLKYQGTKSIVFSQDDTCFKMFTGLYPEEKEELYRKFLEIDGIKINGVILPKCLIVQNGQLEGYTMDFFKDSMSLFDRFASSQYADVHQILDAVKKASQILREIHKNEIICQDLNFDNILINNSGVINYCDMDGCKYKDYESPYLSYMLKRFVFDYRKEKNLDITENTDRLSMMLSLFLLFYLKEIQKISQRNYQRLACDVRTLQNLEEYAECFRKRRSVIPEVPYIDELIDERDIGYLNRENQLDFIQKLTRKF